MMRGADSSLSRIFTFNGINVHAGNDTVQVDVVPPAVGYIRWALICVVCPVSEVTAVIYNLTTDTLLPGEYVTTFRIRTTKYSVGAGNVHYKVVYCLE